MTADRVAIGGRRRARVELITKSKSWVTRPTRPHFYREEVTGDKHFPMRLEKGRPWSTSAALNAIALQQICNRPTAGFVAEITKRTLNCAMHKISSEM